MAGSYAARRLAALGSTVMLTCLVSTLAFSQVGQVPDGPVQGDHFDCRQLAKWEPPVTPRDWFERSLWAGHCHVFQALAVRIGLDGVRTLALSRDIEAGVEQDTARFLDGPAMTFERQGRIGRLHWSNQGEAVASPAGVARHVEKYYRLATGGDDRIANRSAVRLDIQPLDGMRFGHRLWLDTQTALVLKHELIDERGRVVETFQLTELEALRLHDGVVLLDTARELPEQPWWPDWLPSGFIGQPVDESPGRNNAHRIYSDGLSTLSLFVEPIEEGHERLIPGLHRLGISLAVVRHEMVAGRPMQIVAMGELPPRILIQVAENLRWQEHAATED